MTKELITMLCEAGKNELERTFAAVPDDKISWKPAEGARSALNAFGQPAQFMKMMVRMTQAGTIDPTTVNIPAMLEQMAQERAGWSRADAQTHLEMNWSEFKATVEGMTDEQLAVPVTMPFGGGTTAPMAFWLMLTYRVLVARFAQINYIQNLYGDHESH